MTTLVVTAVAASLLAVPTSAAQAPSVSQPGLRVVDKGVAFANDNISSFRPALTRAPNGDILAAFDTIGDVNDPNANTAGEVWVLRSTDRGRTWDEGTRVAAASHFENGVIYSSRGMTTLRDGTILLPYNEGVTYSPVNNRDSLLYIARSTDNGHTWTNTDVPVTLPVAVREHWSCCSRILQLDDGSLLLTLWGTRQLTDNWAQNPEPWRAVSVKSYDGGRTWQDYRTIAWDSLHPPFNNGRSPLGVNEPAVVQLADGRLVALLRYGSVVGSEPRNRVYRSVSDDRGLSWSEPVATTLAAQTPSLTLAPCSRHLPKGQSELLFGYRDVGGGIGQGQAAIVVSYDEGTSFTGKLYLEEPGGAAPGTFISAEPDFLPIDGRRLLTLFQYRVGTTGTYRLGFNVLEAQTPDQCRALAQQAEHDREENPAIGFQRADAQNWPYGYARAQSSFGATTRIGDLAAGSFVTCADTQPRLVLAGTNRVLDPLDTLLEAGVRNGDVILVGGTPLADGLPKVGFADWDDFPAVRSVYGWDDECTYSLGLDTQRRSLGIEQPPGHGTATAITLRSSSTTSTLRASNYSIWASADNRSYTEATGWLLTSTVDADGYLVHRFSNLAVTEKYIKVHQDQAMSTARFVIDDVRRDVQVEYGCWTGDPLGTCVP